MKKKTNILYFAIVASFLLFTFPVKLNALNYTISFTGTGASTSVESVVVQNLTKGTTVTVATGNVLNLSDVTTSVDNMNETINGISIFPNPIQGKSNVSFFAKQTGTTQINLFGIDGRKAAGISRTITQGINSFELSMPQGVYALSVQGNGFYYRAKVISHVNSQINPQITFKSIENQLVSKQQKTKSAEISMLYNTGDQLLYKGISGNYSTIVTDKPTSSKTINFDFIECKDADGNYYSVVKIGTQIWMAENLKTTKFRNNENVTNAIYNNSWDAANYAAWCNFANDVNNGNIYGKIYNWYAINDIRNITPLGWHVPNHLELNELINFLGGENIAGDKLKDVSLNIWPKHVNANPTNESGFSCLPGGFRSISYSSSLGNDGYLWSSTENDNSKALYIRISYGYKKILKNLYDKRGGFSVRCIKDNDNVPIKPFAIGDLYLGGKIAYLDASGLHGFVCALTDQATNIPWYTTATNSLVGANNNEIEPFGVYGITKSGGRKNTDAIIAAQGNGTYAASICAALTIGDATAGEWYLPSNAELLQLYLSNGILGGFANNVYWSSSENDAENAIPLNFQGYSNFTYLKSNGYSVRAIRAF